MSEGKRIRRTPEQIVADLDVQIEKLKDSILELVCGGTPPTFAQSFLL